jgi:hypothetical protein
MGIRQSEALVKSDFKIDNLGNPTGGFTAMGNGDNETVIMVDWQDGIVGDGGQNGAFVEDVLEVARQRLQFFQGSKFRCRENAIALTHIETALAWLDFRTRGRLVQGVENTYDEHVS